MFIIISRILTDDIKKNVQSLVNADIDAYAIIDKELEKSTKRFIKYDNDNIEKEGYMFTNVTHPTLKDVYKVTGWDKALYHAYKSGEKYVWICEDDVYWNRPAVIKMILEKTSNMNDDLIATELAPSFKDTPKWYHWLKCDQITNNKDKWMGTFNQIVRISNRLLKKVDSYAKNHNNLLFHEPLLATLARMNNFKVSYLTDLKLPIYIDIHWLPEFSEKEIQEIKEENTYLLLHPVKSEYAHKAYRNELKRQLK